MSKVKVASIGYGHLGQWHAQKAYNLDNCELIAIVEPFAANQEKAKEKYPDIKVVSDIKEVIGEIDAAVIATPTSFHFEIAKFLLQEGKHVFCEKPVTVTVEEAKDLKIIASEKGVKLQVGHSERCHQVWERLEEFKDITANSSVATIVRNSPFKGRAADVGVVEDLMIHDLDLALMLFGKPKSIRAYGMKVLTDKFDHVKALLSYGDRLVTIENSRNDVKTERSVQINSAKGILRVDLLNNKASYSTDIKAGEEQVINEFDYEKRDHLLIEQERFYNSILNNTKEFVTIDDGIAAMELIAAVNESLEKNIEVELN
ncbi:Gfo/Idh/MocA family protein [Halobacteriovorax sp. RT-2-6]|uniref:Gfo/Idh/MocA family protein n=1 Tax=unclassified Halobacteriovorax TaxID=2639665 RepID=UPI00399AAFCE